MEQADAFIVGELVALLQDEGLTDDEVIATLASALKEALDGAPVGTARVIDFLQDGVGE